MAAKRKKRLIILTCCICSILILSIAGAVWNNIVMETDMQKYPPMGQMVDVFDSKMHVYSIGNGDDTIVLLSGWGTTSPTIDYYPLWSRLSQDAQVVVLERFGYGWSEETSRTRTVQNIMEEDRLALTQAGFSPPYYLVAHSMGGLEAALYASSYPDDVSGVVLIDSRAPEITIESPGQISFMDRLVPSFRAVGLLRLIDTISPSVIDGTYAKQNHYSMVDESLLQAERVLTLRNAQSKMMRGEWKMMSDNAQYVSEQGFPASVPLTAILSNELEDNPRYSEMLEAQHLWVSQSFSGKLVTLYGGHYLHHYDPDGICSIIKEMIECGG